MVAPEAAGRLSSVRAALRWACHHHLLPPDRCQAAGGLPSVRLRPQALHCRLPEEEESEKLAAAAAQQLSPPPPPPPWHPPCCHHRSDHRCRHRRPAARHRSSSRRACRSIPLQLEEAAVEAAAIGCWKLQQRQCPFPASCLKTQTNSEGSKHGQHFGGARWSSTFTDGGYIGQLNDVDEDDEDKDDDDDD
mmetsp:Transcript_30103/g.79330  ORF Transcript_30103/g.79330 Transcript_30103/m.79330 type:complete len:191 (-) Transcript_30103:11-583(-)